MLLMPEQNKTYVVEPDEIKSHIVDAVFFTLPTSSGGAGGLVRGLIVVKHCQRHNGPMTLSTLTYSTHQKVLVWICYNCCVVLSKLSYIFFALYQRPRCYAFLAMFISICYLLQYMICSKSDVTRKQTATTRVTRPLARSSISILTST